MVIREARREDAEQIVRIFHETIHAVNARDYTLRQLHAWSPCVPDATTWAEKKFPTRITFVADDNGVLAGFGELEENGHIDCFYCHRDSQRRGVGTALYKEIERKAKSLGLDRLFTESSITAYPFFLAQGFTVTDQQTITRRGVELTTFAMEKILPRKRRHASAVEH